MNKQVLDRFIQKYHLNGSSESVVWSTKKDKLTTRFITDDKSVLGTITADPKGDATFFKGFNVMDSDEIAVNDTMQLKSLLSVLDDDIKVDFEKGSGKNTALKIADKSTKATYVLADASVIPVVPALKQLPEFELELTIDDAFMNTFVKAKSALSEVETFTVIADDKKVSIVIGYSKLNTNRVTIGVVSTKCEKIDPISFSARYFRDILSANKECKNGTLKVSSQGLAHATFVSDNFDSEYYLVQITTTT